MQAVGFKKSDNIASSIPTTPPWLLARPAVNFTLQCSDKSNTPPEIFKHRFYELCHEFKNYYCIFTDSSNKGNRVAAAVVHRPTQLPPLAIRVSGDLQAVSFKKSDVITSSIPSTLPWLLARSAVNFTLHCSDKSNTSPEVFKHRFYELSHEFKNYYRIFADGSKEGNRVAAAVAHRDNTKCVRLPDAASIFRACDRCDPALKRKEFCNLF